MPRKIDPSNIQVGGGLAASESVEPNAFVHPSTGLDGLTAHVRDPSRAHEARAINVVDTASNFASDHVEGALAELAGTGSSTRLNGLIEGGTYTTSGLDLTLASPTKVLLNGTEHDYSGEAVTLLDNTTQYVYIDSTSGALTRSASAPALSSEHILIAEATAVAGAVTADRDARLFVANLDRKLPFTLRTGGSASHNRSEAAFVTIEAILLHLELYSSGAAPHPNERSEVIVRGNQVVSTTLTVPVDNVIFRGDGRASFTGSGVLAPMFNLGGRSNIVFRDISFKAGAAGSVAFTDAAGTASRIAFQRCRFEAGGARWDRAIDFTNPCEDLQITGCYVDASVSGILLDRPFKTRITDTTVTSVGATATTGISLGDSALAVTVTEGLAVVRGCNVSNFGTGVYSKGYAINVSDSFIRDAGATAVTMEGVNSILSDSHIELGSTGLVGVRVNSGNNNKVRGCFLNTTRGTGTYGAATPVGISIDASDRISLENNHVTNFYSSTSPSAGINIANGSDMVTVSGGVVEGSNWGVQVDASSQAKVLGAHFNGVGIAVTVTGTASEVLVQGCAGDLSSTYGLMGVSASGAGVKVIGCRFNLNRGTWTGETPLGVGFGGSAEGGSVVDCTLEGFYNSVDDLGEGVRVSGSAHNCTISDVKVTTAKMGVYVTSATSAKIAGAVIEEVETGISLSGTGHGVAGSTVILDATRGLNGIAVSAGSNGVEITDNMIYGEETGQTGILVQGTDGAGTRTWNVTVANNLVKEITANGISFTGYVRNSVVSGNTVDGFLPAAPANPTALAGIHLASSGGDLCRHVTVSGNTAWRCKNGILVLGADASNRVEDLTVVGNVVHHCGYALTLPAADTFQGAGSKGIGLEWVRDAAVSDNNVYGIGQIPDATGVAAFPTTGGTAVLSTGIFGQNCEHIRVSNNSVVELASQNGGAVANNEHGIYFRVRNTGGSTLETLSITENNLSRLAHQGVRVEVDTGTVTPGANVFSKVVVAGNTVEEIGDGGIHVHAATDATLAGVVIQGNSVSNLTAANGVYIHAEASASGATITPIQVADNSIGWSLTPVTDQRGIYFEAAAAASTFQGARIEGNTIACAGGANSAGVYIVHASGGPNIRNLSITGNQILSSQQYGIYVSGADSSHVAVQSNTVANYAGDAVHLALGTFTDVGVQNNTLTGSNATDADTAITVGISTNVFSERLRITGNAAHLFSVAGIHLLDTAGGWKDVVVQSNTLRSTGASARGIHLQMPTNGTSTPVTGIAIEQLSVLDNTISDVGLQGIYLEHSGTNLDSVLSTRWSGNTLDNCAGSDNTTAAFHMLCDATVRHMQIQSNVLQSSNVDGSSLIGGDPRMHSLDIQFAGVSDEIEDVAICDNHFNLCGIGSIKVAYSDGTNSPGQTRGITISRNHSGNVRTSANAEGHGIYVDLTGMDIVEHFVVNDNFIEGNSSDLNHGIFVDASLMASAATEGVFGLTVNGNELRYLAGQGIRILADDASGTCDLFERLSACHNKIYSTVDEGIYINLDAVASRVEGVEISNNQVSQAGLSGILFNVAEVSSATTQNVSVCHNTIRECGGHGLALGGSAPGLSGVGGTDFTMRSVTVIGNHASNNGVAAGGGYHGIRIFHEPVTGTTAATNILVANNIVRSHGYDINTATVVGNAGYSYVASNPGGDHGFSLRLCGATTNLVVSNNIADSNAGFGFFFDTGINNQPERSGSTATPPAGTCVAPVFQGNIARGNDVGNASGAVFSSGGGGDFAVGSYGDNWNTNNTNAGSGLRPVQGVNVGNVSDGTATPNANWNDIDDDATWLGGDAANTYGIKGGIVI